MTWAFSGLSGGWFAASWPLDPLVSLVISVMSVDPLGRVGAVVAGGAGGRADADPEDAFGFLDDLDDAERLAADLVVADGVDEVLRADEQQQLAEVDLGDQHTLVAPQHLLGVRRERIEMSQMRVGHRAAVGLEAFDGRADRAVRRAPAEYQQVALRRPEHLERRDVPGDAGDLGLTQELHLVVVVRVVADVARDISLLEATDAVLEARGARHRPRSSQRVGVAQVRAERAVAAGRVVDRDRWQLVDRRDLPRLGAGREERVGQE